MKSKYRIYIFWTAIVLLSIISNSVSQVGVKYIFPGNPVYYYFDYLINSGAAIPRYVLRQPFEMGKDLPAKSTNKKGRFFAHYWNKFYYNNRANIFFSPGDQIKRDNSFLNYYRVFGGIIYSSSNITLVNRTEVNQNYKKDRFFAGDLSESSHWLYGRITDAYAVINFGKFDFFIGRTQRNWGAVGEKSLILSDNPYSYDHINLNYTTDHYKLSLIYAQLENLDAYSKSKVEDVPQLVADARKYLVGHRLDVRLKSNLQIAFTEMATYGGKERDIELVFMNPMTFYYPTQRNDQKQLDGFWSFDIFYKPTTKFTCYGQFLIDDIIVNNDPGVNDRAKYPDRFGMLISLRSADFIDGLNLDLTYVRVWNRTYQSKFTWENYHYRGLGLVYPCASCEEIKIKFAYWGFFPFFFLNEAIYGIYGNVELTDLFPLTKETFPIEPVQYNFLDNLKFYYFYNPILSLFASVEYRDKVEHY